MSFFSPTFSLVFGNLENALQSEGRIHIFDMQTLRPLERGP